MRLYSPVISLVLFVTERTSNNGDVYMLTFHHNLTNTTPKPYLFTITKNPNQPNHFIVSSPRNIQIFFSNLYQSHPQKSKRIWGSPPRKSKKGKKGTSNSDEEDDDDEDDEDRSEDQGVIPEIVTNRTMSSMAYTVGTPLFIGLLFFPFFYYLKVGLKIDVPTWVPFIVSFFFGSALLDVSYGLVSSSWDPLREGSFLGWNEAKKNWPVFWQSIRGGGGANSK